MADSAPGAGPGRFIAPGAGMVSRDATGMVIEPGSSLRGTECIVCRKPIGGSRVTLAAFTKFELCECDAGHLICYQMMLHPECAMAGDPLLMTAFNMYASRIGHG